MVMKYSELEKAILWTLLYADVFDFPMTVQEIQRYLMEMQADCVEIERTLQFPSKELTPLIATREIAGQTHYAIRERADHVFAKRAERETYSQKLWPQAETYGRWLSHLPFVRMVCLTGALAVRNPESLKDDLDYFLVVQSGRVWTARFFAVILVRLAKLWGVILCPNYVLAEDKLVQSRQDSFIAHEIAQMHPIFGLQLYETIRQENDWSLRFLPNAQQTFFAVQTYSSGIGKIFKQVGEFLLKGWVGSQLEKWESRRKIVKFQKQIDHNSAAQLDKNHVKGHFQDHGQRILKKFYTRLDHYELPYPALNITDFSPLGESAAD